MVCARAVILLWSFKHQIHLQFHVHFINSLDHSLTHALSHNYVIAKYCYLFPKGEFIEELFEWVLLFLSRFYLFYRLEILRPYDLYLYCGGWWWWWGGAFYQKNRFFCFYEPIFFIFYMLISKMIC